MLNKKRSQVADYFPGTHAQQQALNGDLAKMM